MAERFKQRICRAITATLQSCRSKDPSYLPENPVPSFSTSHNHNHQKPRPVSSAFISIAAAAASGLSPSEQTRNADDANNALSHDIKSQKEEKLQVFSEIYEPRRRICSSSEDDLSLGKPRTPPPSAADERGRRLKKKKKKKKVKNNVLNRLRLSTSSADSGWFSSEGGGTAGSAADRRAEEETETLVSSSLSFSTDSSSFITTKLPHTRRNKKRLPSNRRNKRGVSGSSPPARAEMEIPTRLSVFKKLIPCTLDGKVKESFAIMKRSEDPYEDFKNSMMDMILEKHMFDRKDLEQLLECFLSLNSRRYHEIIVEAFSEIWEAIFSPSGFQIFIQDSRRVP